MGINRVTQHPSSSVHHPLATPSNSDVVADDEPTPECPQIDLGNVKFELRQSDLSQKWDFIHNSCKQPP
jgi:hypothetical protein